MKKFLRKSPLLLALAALIFPGAAALGTVTLQISTVTSVASNWANGAGEADANLAWGIIVDRNGNGLASNYAVTGVDYGLPSSPAGKVGQSLLDASGTATDDLLFMSPIAMLSLPESLAGRDGVAAGQNLMSTITSVLFAAGMDAGDAFHLVWFDADFGSSAAPVFGTPQAGDSYGIYSSPDLVIPGDGSTISYSHVFTGVDPLHLMTQTWSSGVAAAPEPSSVMLALLGALGLLRRRR